MIGGARALVLTGLVGLMLAGVTGLFAGIKGYNAGREKERLVQAEIISKMVDRHRADFDEATRKADAKAETWRLQRLGAEREQERERAATRAALAAVNADRGRLRDELAAVASGGVQAADDSIGACRDRAAALGDVLGEALLAHAVCSAETEDLAAGVRALQRAWPSSEPAN